MADGPGACRRGAGRRGSPGKFGGKKREKKLKTGGNSRKKQSTGVGKFFLKHENPKQLGGWGVGWEKEMGWAGFICLIRPCIYGF